MSYALDHGAKDLIRQLDSMQPEDDLFDAKVTVLGEYVKHHVKEEEEEMFPKARRRKVNLKTLGGKLMAPFLPQIIGKTAQ